LKCRWTYLELLHSLNVDRTVDFLVLVEPGHDLRAVASQLHRPAEEIDAMVDRGVIRFIGPIGSRINPACIAQESFGMAETFECVGADRYVVCQRVEAVLC
jgi:hypothetical protein